MKLFLHVGMGKTGTSSIQQALSQAEDELHAQGLHYLGMWFSIVHPKFDGIAGMRTFVSGDPEQLRTGAQAIVREMEKIKAQTGCDTFVFSNEDLYGHVANLDPLIEELAKEVDLRIILYIRDIQSWLPSAYVQWAIRHKTRPGPIQTFRDQASRWVGTYRALAVWERKYSDFLTFCKFDKTVDVFEDFGRTIGVTIPPVKKRVLERGEDVELLLRALYNTRFKSEVFPDRFNTFVMNPNRDTVQTLEEATKKYLTFDGGTEVFADDLDDFKALGERIGVDFTSGQEKEAKQRDMDAMRARMLEYLIEVTLSQAAHMQRMSNRLKKLEEKMGDD